MGNLSSSIGVQNRYPKARQFARSPVLFASIQLGKNLQGFILNASEGGVCVQTAREIVGDEPLDLRFQSVRPGAWVNARGRIVWKNESNTVAGLQFVDADKEIAGEVRNWLNFGESLQELRGDWWPDSQPADHPTALAPAVPEATPIALPPRAPAPIEMPAPLSAAATLPDYSNFETELLTLMRNRRHPSSQLTLAESDSNRDSDSRIPEGVPPAVIGFPSPQPRSQRHSYDYVRPSSTQEEHREKFAIAGVAAAAVVLLLVGWFIFGHKRQPGRQPMPPRRSCAPRTSNRAHRLLQSRAESASHAAIPAVQPAATQPPTHSSIPKPVAPATPATLAPPASTPRQLPSTRPRLASPFR